MIEPPHYRVRVDPKNRQLELTLELTGVTPGDRELFVPTWVPGAYAFLKYGRDVFDVRAEDAKTGRKLTVTRSGFSGFVVKGAPASITVRARITASDAAWGELVGVIGHEMALVRAAHFLFDPRHAGPCRVTFELPEGWALHHPGGAKAISATSFEHPSFHSLLDSPIVLGRFEHVERDSAGCRFHHVFTGTAVGYAREVAGFVDDVMLVADAAREVFGAFPTASYTFAYATDPRAHWGLEHPNVSLMAVGDAVFFDREERRTALRLAAHELFHAWNVCRLKPKALVAPDLVVGAFPDGLWISEGFTRYYELLLTTRTGVLDATRFLSNLVRYDDALRALPATRHATLVDSSLATFLNHNRYPGSSSASIDYYDKGMLVAFVLDACLRTAARPSSLDRAMGAFYERFVANGFDTVEAIAFFDELAEPLGPREPVGAMLSRIVEGPGMPDVGGWLERLGLAVERASTFHLGIWLRSDRGPEITDVAEGSPAARAGVGAGDEIVAHDGFSFRPDALRYLVRSGEPLSLTIKSGHALREVRVTPAAREVVTGLSLPTGGAALVDWLGAGASSLAAGATVPLGHYDNFHSREVML